MNDPVSPELSTIPEEAWAEARRVNTPGRTKAQSRRRLWSLGFRALKSMSASPALSPTLA